MTKSWLYRYEVKGIQSFILATDKLKEIKGASSLVEEVGSLFGEVRKRFEFTQQNGVEDLALAVAGGASIEVPSELLGALESLMSVWPLIVARHAPGLQLVQARVPGSSADAEAWSSLHGALRSARSRVTAELPEPGPLVLRAPRTGLAAVGFEDGIAVDAAGERKLRVAAADALGRRIDPTWNWVEDLDELEHSYVGVLHLDGNDLGNRVKRLVDGGKADQLLRFSKELAHGTLTAVRKAVESQLLPKTLRSGRIPARPIVVGGDDVTFVVRGDLALPFAKRLLEEFERATAKAIGGPLYASAGVALVHRHHPFRAAHDLAEELCKSAKSALRGGGPGKSTPSSLAFYRLTSSASGTWREIRDRELAGRPPTTGKDAPIGWLSLCPYLLGGGGGRATLDQLMALVDALGPLPDGPVREWLSLLRDQPARAQQHFARFQEVQKSRRPAALERLTAALQDLGTADGWRQLDTAGPGVFGSPVLDALTWARLTKPHSEARR